MSEAGAHAEVARHADVLEDHGAVLDRHDRAIDTLRAELQAHEVRGEERHIAVMAALTDMRARQDRTAASYVWDLGADQVPIPMIGTLKVRSLVVLVILSVGSLVTLGISGEDVWRPIERRLGGAPVPLPAPSADSPAPQP